MSPEGNLRDWKMLHRYAIQYLTLEDGTSICAGLICMPKTLSRYENNNSDPTQILCPTLFHYHHYQLDRGFKMSMLRFKMFLPGYQ